MNLRQLRIFRIVAETGNITAGAERMHISQPAVSKHILDLESELGTPLLDRHPRGVTLTVGGEVMLRHARRMQVLQNDVRDELASLKGVSSGRLAIGASTTIGSYLLPMALEGFHRTNPGIRISLAVENTHHIQAQLLDYALDIGLTEGFVDSNSFDAEVFAHDRLIPVTSAKFRQEHKIRDLLTLAELPCIQREKGSGTRAVVERAFAQHSARPSTLMSLGNAEAIKRIVASGLGYTVISELAVSEELSDGRLVRLPVRELTIARPLHLVRLKGRSTSPALAAFVDLLRSGFPAEAEPVD